MKRILCIAIMLALMVPVASFGQTVDNRQDQDQTQIMYGGDSGGSGSGEIPRSFPIPMGVPNSPQHAGYWGVITPDWTFQKVYDITRFKGIWYPSDIEKLGTSKDKNQGRNLGKVLIQASIFESFGPSDAIAVVATEAPQNSQELEKFRRHFRQIGSISGKGEDGADSEQVMGEVMKKALANGAILMIPANEGAQLVLDSKTSYFGLGVSPSMVAGGSNSAPGGSVVLGYVRGKASVRYNAAPWQQWKLFARGTESSVGHLVKLWKVPAVQAPKARVAPQTSNMGKIKEGVHGVEKDPRFGAEAPDKPLSPPVVNQQR